jgi:uncharacterized membrane protein (UPF0127 family)
MARLYKTSAVEGAELLLENLELAESFWARGKGLLGRKKIEDNEALWIKPCNNIHTFFMKFRIDCIFIDKKMEIQKIVSDIPSFRLIGPFWKSFSVIETQAGFAEKKKLKTGDQLYVVS